jgi:hypothetical protein
MRGSVLLITMAIGLVVGTVLGSYLLLTSLRNEEASRSLAWNTGIPVLEAGIEEGLTHLNSDINDPTANQWTADTVNGHPVFWKTRSLPDGSYYYVTNLNISSPTPLIISAGFVPSPIKKGEYICRVVQVNTTNAPSEFSRAIVANGLIRLSGNSVVDGYNSAYPYDTFTNRNASGGIATDSQQNPAINVGSAHVYGTAVTGPGGTVSVSGGSVGDLGNTGGIQPNWTDNNMNAQLLPNSPPTATFLSFTPGAGTNVLTSGNYQVKNFVCNSASSPLIIAGNVTLWVQDNFIINNTGYVYIDPQNASLKLYVGGDPNGTLATASISGGGIVNGTGVPANFVYYGLPSNTTLNYNGTADFVGTINAPQANFSLSGSGSVYGAIICNSLTSSGTSNIHYDHALVGNGLFLVTSWKELPF